MSEIPVQMSEIPVQMLEIPVLMLEIPVLMSEILSDPRPRVAGKVPRKNGKARL